MSQWTKGKFKQRGPPPALFVQSSPAASSVSLAGGGGGGDAGAGPGGGTAASGTGLGLGSAAAGGSSTATGMPSLPTLTRTASRFRQEASGSGVSSSAVLSPTSSNQKQTGEPGDVGTGTPLSGGTTAATLAAAGPGAGAAPAFTLPLPMPPLRQASSTRATDRTDALWAEMQATLEEVELSASGGTRVFGPDHDHKLAALREAQIGLAQAWARSEAEEAGAGGASAAGADEGERLSASNTNANANANLRPATTAATSVSGGAGRDEEASAGGGGGNRGGGTAASGSVAGLSRVSRDRDNIGNPSSTAAGGGGGGGGGGRPLEQETQVDILLARKRREANDRYFQRVNQGVLDVVSKLEDVAGAMRAVEQESADIWGGGSAVGGGDNESGPRTVA